MTDHDLTPEEREREATAKRESAEVLAAEKEMASLGLIEGIDLTHMAIKAVKGAREARRAALDSRQAEQWVTLDQHARVIEAMADEELRRKAAEAEVGRLLNLIEELFNVGLHREGKRVHPMTAIETEQLVERVERALQSHSRRLPLGALSNQPDDGSLDQAVTMANDLGGEVARLSAEVERLLEALLGIAKHAERATAREAGRATTHQGDALYIISRKARSALSNQESGDD